MKTKTKESLKTYVIEKRKSPGNQGTILTKRRIKSVLCVIIYALKPRGNPLANNSKKWIFSPKFLNSIRTMGIFPGAVANLEPDSNESTFCLPWKYMQIPYG
jgi:hypothetical protein